MKCLGISLEINVVLLQMNEKIKSLEAQLLQEKSWQLQGEVTGQKRPENSLLEEMLVFDHAVRMGKPPNSGSFLLNILHRLFTLAGDLTHSRTHIHIHTCLKNLLGMLLTSGEELLLPNHCNHAIYSNYSYHP